MGNREAAGTVYVVVDGDIGPILAKYAQAEAQSRAAGGRIAQGLGSGLSQVSGLVDQFGRAISSGITNPAAAAIPVVEKTTVQVKQLGAAAEHSVPQIAAMSGAIRTLSGEGSIRAVERLGVSVLGLGAAAQTAFPLIGAIAAGELFTKVYEKLSGVSEKEKQATEQAKQFTDQIKSLDGEVESLRVRFETLKNGAQAGLKEELKVIGEQMAEAALQLRNAREKLRGGTVITGDQLEGSSKGLTYKVPAHPSSIQRTPEAAAAEIAGIELAKVQEEGDIKIAELAKKREEEQKRQIAQAKQALDEKRRLFRQEYEDTLSFVQSLTEIDKAQELRFRQAEAADKRLSGLSSGGLNPVAGEIAKQIGTLSQEVDKGVDRTVNEGRKLQIEEAKKQLKELHTEMLRGVEEAAQEGEREIEQGLRLIERNVTEANRLAEETIRATGIRQQSSDEISKLETEQRYTLQIAHTRAEELQYARDIAAADEKALRDRIANLESLKEYQVIQALYDEANRTDLEIEQAKAALKKQELQDTTRIAQLSPRRQLGQDIRQIGERAPAQLGNALASGMTGGGNIGKQVADALKGIGRDLLGATLTAAIKELAVKTGLATLASHALGAIFGSTQITNTAATTANTATTVGQTTAMIATTTASVAGMAALTTALATNTAALIVNTFVPKPLGFAGGGRPPVGVPSIVGEMGPELFIPDTPGVIIPNVPNSNGMGSTLLTSSMVSNSANHALSIGALHLHGVQDARELARRLPNVLKAVSPRFSPATR